jgi:dipeptidyl aminopeptidase/acylaminoacyl peptidase
MWWNTSRRGKGGVSVFPDEGHDVLKYENRVTCYNVITDFFRKYLMPAN